MTLNLDRPVLALDAGQVLSLDDAAGARISVRLGAVWVTYEGSLKDVVLSPGESLVVAKDGRTLVQALKPAYVSIQ